MYRDRHVTAIIPALNEAPSIAPVVNGLLNLRLCHQCHEVINTTPHSNLPDNDPQFLTNVSRHQSPLAVFCECRDPGDSSALVDQVIVGDNGSTDSTSAIATDQGALVVHEPERGYGAACLTALQAATNTDLIVFVDGDHSVDPLELTLLLRPLTTGADLVIGSRTLGHCETGALSIPQTMGNRLASFIMRLLWKETVTDLGPFRATTQNALTKMQMSDRQFGWTVEMQVRAFQLSLNTVEVGVSTHRRIGKSKISGTVKGVFLAAHGILGTIGKLYWRQKTGTHRTSSGHGALSAATPLISKPDTNVDR